MGFGVWGLGFGVWGLGLLLVNTTATLLWVRLVVGQSDGFRVFPFSWDVECAMGIWRSWPGKGNAVTQPETLQTPSPENQSSVPTVELHMLDPQQP